MFTTTTADAYTSSHTKPLYRGTQFVWYILGIIEALLIFRFALRLLAANPAAGFTAFIYSFSYPFAGPFINVFRMSPVQPGGVVEWATILAMFVYWLAALGIVKLLVMSKSVSTPEAAVKLEAQEK